MRKLFLLALVCVFFASCSKKTVGVASPKGEILICTSFYPMYVMTMNIARDVPGVRVVNMAPPTTGCLHDYQLSPADMELLSRANIFVVNGGGMESFLDKVLHQLPNLKIIDASRGESEGNPHLWVSVTENIQEVQNIAEDLAELDKAHVEWYSRNSQVYLDRLQKLGDRMHQELSNITKRNIITFHEAFYYFAKEFNLNVVDTIEREPGTEPSAKELAVCIREIKDQKADVLFAEPQYSSLAAETIARETGLKVYMLDPVASGPMEIPAVYDAYLNAMEKNLRVLQEALK